MVKLKSLFVLVVGLSFCYAGNYTWETKKFSVPLDHFSYANEKFFEIKYLINQTYTRTKSDPIFFYTGNEGSIENFAENTGLMWELAPKFNAILVFAEHRYYGSSLPFGNESYSGPDKLGYLTSEQALADFADLIMNLNPTYERPVIAFGGSYGGMLSAWFRMKYPFLVDGALAASAPIRQFEVECDIFNQILTSIYQGAAKACSQNIQKLWIALQKMYGTQTGKDMINNKFKFCTNLTKPEDLDKFYDYLSDVLGNLAMMNYPYPSTFLTPLPAYPVRAFCSYINDTYTADDKLIDAFIRALGVYTNNPKCLDIESAYDPSSIGDLGWNFQACTEMIMPMCSNGSTTDMFVPKPWNITQFSDACYAKYKVRPRATNLAVTEYGGGRIEGSSNIIFSNGLLDPWSGGGIFQIPQSTREVYYFIIPEGAHHIDLRESNKDDPASVTEVRKQYVQIFKKWIRSAHYGFRKHKKRSSN